MQRGVFQITPGLPIPSIRLLDVALVWLRVPIADRRPDHSASRIHP